MKQPRPATRYSNRLACFAAVGVVSAALLLRAQEPPKPPHLKGYLSPVAVESLMPLIPPAPVTNDPRDMVDQDVFLATRKYKDSPRWRLAVNDADLTVAGLMNAFACSFGPATPLQMPHLARLLERVSVDSFTLFGSLKNRYARQRPFLVHEGPVCVDPATLSKSFDFPSGHSTLGYAAGLILAELDPRNAPAILVRARQYGESRLFCGAHNASAVEAGRLLGASLFAMLQGSPEFQKDLQAARAEARALAAKHAPAPPACEQDAATLSVSPYSDLPQAAPPPVP